MFLRILLSITAIVSLLSHSSASYAYSGYQIEIDRAEHRLLIKKNNTVLRSFYVALGSGGKSGKQHEGDKRTPVGEYRISEVRDSDRFYLFMQIDYPNMRDASRALKQRLISREEYREILDAHLYGRVPPQNTRLGGVIGIHGIGRETKDKLEIHEMADWTQGCIALRNEEIDQLKQYVSVGTPVIIK